MDRMEKAAELLEQAKRLGLSVEFESGLNILKTTAQVDLELIKSLARYLPEVRSISKRRAIAALAQKHIGARIFSKDCSAGTLVEAHDDGSLTILVSQEMRRSDENEIRRSQTPIMAKAESLLLILDEAEADGSSSHANQKVEVERPRKRLFGLI